MAYVCNLSPSHRPPQPSLKNGPVQRRVRRAFVATGQSVLSTTQIMDWSHPRPGTNRHHARRSVRRVCTRDQDLIAQDAELMAAGCAKVFKEKVSGAKTDRPELAKVIGRLEPGDVLLVTRLDRLARSTRDLLNVLAAVGDRGAGFKSLKDAWADTTTAHGRLMLTVLGGLAEFERELIMARTGEGRLRAKARVARQSDACHLQCLNSSHHGGRRGFGCVVHIANNLPTIAVHFGSCARFNAPAPVEVRLGASCASSADLRESTNPFIHHLDFAGSSWLPRPTASFCTPQPSLAHANHRSLGKSGKML